jgi:radical SAM superfamily enzyme YgiQ (UPF0313 family)
MKICLIRPPVLMPAFNMAGLVVPPLGPAYVAGALRQRGHHVTFIDAVGLAIEQYLPEGSGRMLHGLRSEEILARIPAGIEAIGVSVHFSYEWPICRDLVRAIRKEFPTAFIIAGGEHATALPEFCLQESPLDAVVMGEGEKTAADALDAWQAHGRQGLASVAGLAWRDQAGVVHRNAAAARIQDLASIARPAWDLLPLEEYLHRGYGFGVDRGRSIPVLASRGCPYQCTFCSNPSMWTVRWKARPPEDLLDEIADLQNRYHAVNFDFYDLTMIVKREWILDFCAAIERRNMHFTWQLPSGTRSEAIDAEVARLLYKTGCRNVSYSPESGSPETLQRIKKRVDIGHLMDSMRTAVQNGLNVKCNFIFGFPSDRWRNILETFRAICASAFAGIHDISIWVFVPYPGSELFRQLQAEGKIPVLDDAYFERLAAYADITKTYSYCPALSRRALLSARVAGILLFYALSWLVRPWRPFQLAYHAISGKLESRSELALRGFLKRWWSRGSPAPSR